MDLLEISEDYKILRESFEELVKIGEREGGISTKVKIREWKGEIGRKFEKFMNSRIKNNVEVSTCGLIKKKIKTKVKTPRTRKMKILMETYSKMDSKERFKMNLWFKCKDYSKRIDIVNSGTNVSTFVDKLKSCKILKSKKTVHVGVFFEKLGNVYTFFNNRIFADNYNFDHKGYSPKFVLFNEEYSIKFVWSNSSWVIIREKKIDKEFLEERKFCSLGFLIHDTVDEDLEKIAQKCREYNINRKYDIKDCNCQSFCQEILLTLDFNPYMYNWKREVKKFNESICK